MYTKTYSQKLHGHYKKADEDNEKPGGYYYCATADGVTPRRLDLSATDVFCINKTEKGNRPEYRIQAYLVKQAKANNWLLPIKDQDGKNVDWILLDAERNFAETDKPKKLDLLAFSPELKAYVILELKKDRAFATAKRELEQYIKLMTENRSGANVVFSSVIGDKSLEYPVYGYVVAPATEIPGYNKNNDAFQYGVILFPFAKPEEGQTPAEAQKALFVSGTPSFKIYKKDPQQG